MKAKLLTLAAVPILLCSCGPQEIRTIPDGYELLWSDEFEGETLNENFWSFETGNHDGWGNGEVEYYKRENAVVKDGQLHIVAKKEKEGDFDYTSARIKTADKVKFTYGIVEARIALPAVKGMWPAFWMMPNDSIYGNWPDSGEIDIMEGNGGSQYGTSSALHYAVAHKDVYEVGYNNLNTREVRSNITEFHVYRMDWQEDSIAFFCDDRLIKEIPQRVWQTSNVDKDENPIAPFDKDFFIIFNLAISGNYVHGDMPPASFTDCEMLIDYVRVYQYKE